MDAADVQFMRWCSYATIGWRLCGESRGKEPIADRQLLMASPSCA